jgi:hypothetical protein
MASTARSSPLRVVHALLVAGLALALSPGCKPKAGDACESTQDTCKDPTTALSCVNAALVEAPCRGPAGCTKAGTRLTCDDTVSVAGEPCLAASAGSAENRACTADKKESLACSGGMWKVVEACTGPKGCAIHGDAVSCDVRGATAGAPCPGPGTYACAIDAKSRLACKDGTFAFDRFCRGQAGCRDSDVSCDQTLALLGDPCGTPGMVACAADGHSALVCTGGQFVTQRGCASQGCQVTEGRQIDCR